MEILNLLSNLDGQIASFIALHGNLVYLLLFLIVFLEIGIFPLFFFTRKPTHIHCWLLLQTGRTEFNPNCHNTNCSHHFGQLTDIPDRETVWR